MGLDIEIHYRYKDLWVWNFGWFLEIWTPRNRTGNRISLLTSVLPDCSEDLGPNILLERARFVILFTESQNLGGQTVNKIFCKNGPNSK